MIYSYQLIISLTFLSASLALTNSDAVNDTLASASASATSAFSLSALRLPSLVPSKMFCAFSTSFWAVATSICDDATTLDASFTFASCLLTLASAFSTSFLASETSVSTLVTTEVCLSISCSTSATFSGLAWLTKSLA